MKKQLMIKTNRHAITTIHNMKNQLNINFKIIKKTVKTRKIMIWKKNLIWLWKWPNFIYDYIYFVN